MLEPALIIYPPISFLSIRHVSTASTDGCKEVAENVPGQRALSYIESIGHAGNVGKHAINVLARLG